ncbi:helix-turn-helix domain-containing protein [Fictibacillus nanhaiensis]|uniref:helix-turn-helix domain-containing protein n=1 Tax=Fictibacillus nanhaiensis TaxID=742169 RepID=UPI00203DCD9D|nr:helix-turn-helix transcriptional regulator [Fictibacillus nanhaiensis]MCM3732734.1 helix-turn-helix domain-containing protein [Fictibacillus nanhaiensis]
MTIETFVAVRKMRGLSQTEYGKALGISRGMVACIETGKRNLTDTTKSKVHQVFGNEFVEQVRRLTEGR